MWLPPYFPGRCGLRLELRGNVFRILKLQNSHTRTNRYCMDRCAHEPSMEKLLSLFDVFSVTVRLYFLQNAELLM